MEEAVVILNSGAEGMELRLSDPSTSGRKRGVRLECSRVPARRGGPCAASGRGSKQIPSSPDIQTSLAPDVLT